MSGSLPEGARERRVLPRLLVVDDQPVNIRVLHQIFQEEAEVLMATSGAQALEVAAREKPDLILLDIVMPDIDGLSVCRRLKRSPDLVDIPVIFVTAQSSAEEETAGLEAGAVDFITKPVNPSVVRARVNTHLLLREQSRQLREIAFTDGLTGVANRRRFDEAFSREWAAAIREQSQIALILIDIDHFKRFNDEHGHQAGDQALRWVAHALKSALRRPTDLLARYGGEEFVCLLPRSDQRAATDTAEYLRATVAAGGYAYDPSQGAPHLTVSLGVAATVPRRGSPPACLLESADAQLYEAKAAGRNRVNASEPDCAGARGGRHQP